MFTMLLQLVKSTPKLNIITFNSKRFSLVKLRVAVSEFYQCKLHGEQIIFIFVVYN